MSSLPISISVGVTIGVIIAKIIYPTDGLSAELRAIFLLIKENPDKLNWNLNDSPHIVAIKMLKENPDKINWNLGLNNSLLSPIDVIED